MKKTKTRGFTLIEILVVIGIIAVLAAIVIVAINPARQFAQARDTQRTSDATAISNAIAQYMADNKGSLPSAITTSDQDISDSAANLCPVLYPTYLTTGFPQDPSSNGGAPITSCTTYDSKFHVSKDTNGRVTVTAPVAELTTVSITR